MSRFHLKKKEIRFILISLIVCVVLIFAVQKLAEWEREHSTVNPSSSGYTSYIFPTPSAIQSGDLSYIENKNLITILLLGIDTHGKAVSSGSYNNDQQADFLALLVIDPDTNDCNLLHINRDTMTDIAVLGVTGQAAGTSFGQIALAHTYGSGLQDSCKNTADTVSNFLYGVTIDYYISINMDAVSILNDQVGGVTVTVTDDFSNVDPELVNGETVTLTGQHALNFVRARKDMQDPTNLSRMARQRQYINAFFQQLKSKLAASDEDFILGMYNSVSGYIVTNCTVQTFSTISDRLLNTDKIETETLTGTAKQGVEFIEYHVDKNLLFEKVMNLFFEKTTS